MALNGDDSNGSEYNGQTWKDLQELGFTGTTLQLQVKLAQGGIGRPRTISKPDFLAVLDYGRFFGKKKQAIALNNVLRKVTLENYLRRSFGETELSWQEIDAMLERNLALASENLAEINNNWTLAEERFFDYSNWSKQSLVEIETW